MRAEENLEAARRDLAVRVHREHRGVAEGVLRVRALDEAVRSAQQLVLQAALFASRQRTTVDVLNAEQQLQDTLRDISGRAICTSCHGCGCAPWSGWIGSGVSRR